MGYLTLSLQGDRYAMGRQHGRQVQTLRPQIARAIEIRFAQIEEEGSDARFERLVQETHDLLQEIDRPLVDLVRGQAEALEFEFDSLLRYGLVTYLRDDLTIRNLQSSPAPRSHAPGVEPGSEGCTIWAACGAATAQSGSAHSDGRTHQAIAMCIAAALAARGYSVPGSTKRAWPSATATSRLPTWGPGCLTIRS